MSLLNIGGGHFNLNLSTRNNHLKKAFKIISRLLLIIFIWYGINIIRILSYANKYSEKQSDVALVLGAGTSNGKLSPVFRERINHAVHLLKQGRVNCILITGGYGKGQTISDSKVAQNYAINGGVEKSKILIEEESKKTFENIENAQIIMEEHNLKNALLVSDPYHMLRAHLMCKKFDIEHAPSPTPTTMFRGKESKFDFLLSEAFYLWTFQLYHRFR